MPVSSLGRTSYRMPPSGARHVMLKRLPGSNSSARAAAAVARKAGGSVPGSNISWYVGPGINVCMNLRISSKAIGPGWPLFRRPRAHPA